MYIFIIRYIAFVMHIFGFALDYSYYIIVKYEKKFKNTWSGSRQNK